MTDDLHENSALYVLDVLDEDERSRFEEHLAGCATCQGELRGLRDTASALAFVEIKAPPSALRERILSAARAEPQNVVPLRPRRSLAVSVAAIAAVAATAAAVGLGIWAASLHHSLAGERAASSVLRDPLARHVQLQGRPGELVVARSGDAVLTVALPAPPSGKVYEAWVASPRPQPAGVFNGHTFKLAKRVPRGAQVMVTVENAGGAGVPTHAPIVSARA
ncbi:MAG: anti-sigma factor [Actinobacteria bacterium]|nr:anti-sigma factor [Actinomycetota bacterium]